MMRAVRIAMGSLLLCASAAHAGPVENMAQVVVAPTDPSMLVVRYTNGGDGLFYTRDGGERWQLLCASAIGEALGPTKRIAIAGDGTVMMGVYGGMWRDDATGCAWSMEAPFEGKTVSDFAVHPSDPTILFAVTTGAGHPNGMWQRVGSGAFTALGTSEDIIITRLQVATIDGDLRFYQSAIEGTVTTVGDAGVEMERSNYVIRVSDNDGENWTTHAFGASDGELRLQMVDPSDPDRLIVSIDRENADDSLLVSSDQGASFDEYLTLTQIGGIAMAPDGRVWIADSGSSSLHGAPRGLWFSTSLGAPAQALADGYPVRCLAYEPENDRLYACQNFAFGSVATDGTFTASLTFGKAEEFLTCPGVDMASVCETQLCLDYCGPGHFAAFAPLCKAYDEPACGPCADDPQSEVCLAATSDAGAKPPRDAMVGEGDAGDAAVCAEGAACDDNGCSCATLGARSHSSISGLGAACVALALLWRRRLRV